MKRDGEIKLSRIQINILKEIKREPGIGQSGIAKYLGASRKVVFYHIRFLKNADKVSEIKERKKTQYFLLSGA